MSAPTTTALTQVYTQDLAELLFLNMDFIGFSMNHDGHIANSVVNIPYEAAAGYIEVTENPTGTSSISGRSDAFLTYQVSDIQTNATRITIKNETQSNYSLRETSIKSHGSYLNQYIGNKCLYSWGLAVVNQTLGTASGGGSIPTTGSTVSNNLPSSATGVRAQMTKEDLLSASSFLDSQLAPEHDRYAILPSVMYNELLLDADIRNIDYMNGKGQVTAKVPELYGITLLKRRDVMIANASLGGELIAPASWGAATAATKSHAALVWSASTVAKAFGGQEASVSEKDPIYWNHTYLNSRAFFGSKFARFDGVGVATIYQANA